MIILKTWNTTVHQDETTQDISIVEKYDSNDREVLNRILEVAENSRIHEIDDDLNVRLYELVKERDGGNTLKNNIEELRDLKHKVGHLTRTNEELEEELDSFYGLYSELQIMHANLNKELREEREDNQVLAEEILDLECTVQDFGNEHDAWIKDIEEMYVERDENREELYDTIMDKEYLERELGKKRDENKDQEELNFRLKEELDSFYGLCKEWALGYKELKKQIAMQDDTILDQENVIEEQEDIIQDLRDDVADLENDTKGVDVKRAVQGLIHTLYSEDIINHAKANRLKNILWSRED